MQKLNIIAEDKLTIAGILVLGSKESLQKTFKDFRIEYLEIAGTTYSDGPERYYFRLSSEENLFNTYFAVFDKLSKKIDVPFKLDGAFQDTKQTQLLAIREALVNLLMHSDYFSGVCPRIRVFTDRIEFFNGGGLPKKLEYILKEDYSFPRNKTVARLFRFLKLSENIGSGFYKMFNGWEQYYNSKPVIEYDFDHYSIKFYFGDKIVSSKNNNVNKELKFSVKTLENFSLKTSQKTSQKILEILSKRQEITIEDIAKILEISERAVKYHLQKLKKEGRINRIGSDKVGYWVVK